MNFSQAGAPVTVADLLKKLGGIPAERVRLEPPPGTATEKDVITIQAREKRNCELVDGVLVEKPADFPAAVLAASMGYLLYRFLTKHDLGILAGASGPFRLRRGLVRMPTISFISWSQLPKRKVPKSAIAKQYPELAIEILTPSNTKAEMDRKIREYFQSGTRLVWLVNWRKRTVRVYIAPNQSFLLKNNQSLDGDDVLPGLSLPLREVFSQLEEEPARKKRPKK